MVDAVMTARGGRDTSALCNDAQSEPRTLRLSLRRTGPGSSQARMGRHDRTSRAATTKAESPSAALGRCAWLGHRRRQDRHAGAGQRRRRCAGSRLRVKEVAPRGLTRLLAPWVRPGRSERIGRSGSLLGPPWPVIALATGRLSIPYIRAVKRLAGPDTFTVILQDPKTSANSADLIWVPEHDRRRGANVMSTVTAPHSFSRERLASLRAQLPPAIAALPRPRVAVVLGGSQRHLYLRRCQPSAAWGQPRNLGYKRGGLHDHAVAPLAARTRRRRRDRHARGATHSCGMGPAPTLIPTFSRMPMRSSSRPIRST